MNAQGWLVVAVYVTAFSMIAAALYVLVTYQVNSL